MNLGVDVRILNKSRAVSRYTKFLMREISRTSKTIKLFLFTDEPKSVEELGLEGSFEIVPTWKKFGLRDHFQMKKLIAEHPIDIFFHPDNTEFIYCHSRSVVTIHDLIPKIYPNLVLSSNAVTFLRQYFYLILQEKAIEKSAKRIITVSNNTREDIIRYLNIDPDIISVTYEGIESNFRKVLDSDLLGKVRSKYNLPENFIFYIGGLDERKNLLRLIHAFSKLVEDYQIYLVIGGKTEEPETEGKNSFLILKKEIERLGLASLVAFTGFIEEDDLPAVYSLAEVFVYPSFYEGFGRPPLEAMACGVPVLTSNSSSLPEICGEAALFVDPYETEEFFSGLSVLLRDKNLREKYIEKGTLQASKYKWSEAAKKTISAFKKL